MVTGFFSNILGLGGQAPVAKIESESDEEMEVSLYISLKFYKPPKDSDRLNLE
jgi:hypothetical protein